jgi:shikimate dehydrogenase
MGVPYAEVIGDPVAHSKSPPIHNFWLEKLGLDGDFRTARVAPGGVGDYLSQRRTDADWRGCNVTLPHKETALRLLDRVDDGARRVGAVNVVVPVDGELVGYNSDCLALRAELEDGLREASIFDLPVVVFGAGGAARAVLAVIAEAEDVEVLVYNRDVRKAQCLLSEFGLRGSGLALNGELPAAAIIVNASSLGMTGFPPLEPQLPARGKPAVMDLVYAPVETQLLKAARGAGLRTIDGLYVLIAQARFSFEHFFRMVPPVGYEDELRELLTR